MRRRPRDPDAGAGREANAIADADTEVHARTDAHARCPGHHLSGLDRRPHRAVRGGARHEPAPVVSEYRYGARAVYFVPQRCCDIFSDLYDAAPDPA